MSLVLVVDDNFDILSSLRAAIATCGHQAIIASSGHEGLKAIERDRPALVFLDYHMPGLSGFDVLRVLQESSRDMCRP